LTPTPPSALKENCVTNPLDIAVSFTAEATEKE
jgi:hypothetical protein